MLYCIGRFDRFGHLELYDYNANKWSDYIEDAVTFVDRISPPPFVGYLNGNVIVFDYDEALIINHRQRNVENEFE